MYFLNDGVIILTNSPPQKAFFKILIEIYNMHPNKWSENYAKILVVKHIGLPLYTCIELCSIEHLYIIYVC